MYVRKYGEDQVVQIVTFGTMAAKGVIRDVARVLDLPYALCDTHCQDGSQRTEYYACTKHWRSIRSCGS